MGFAQGFSAVGPRLLGVDGILSTVALGRNQDTVSQPPAPSVVVGGSETLIVSSPTAATNVGSGPGVATPSVGVTVEVTP